MPTETYAFPFSDDTSTPITARVAPYQRDEAVSLYQYDALEPVVVPLAQLRPFIAWLTAIADIHGTPTNPPFDAVAELYRVLKAFNDIQPKSQEPS